MRKLRLHNQPEPAIAASLKPSWLRGRCFVSTAQAPSGYVQMVPQQVAPAAVGVPMYAAPASPCAPAATPYTPGYQYAAPPVPGNCGP